MSKAVIAVIFSSLQHGMHIGIIKRWPISSVTSSAHLQISDRAFSNIVGTHSAMTISAPTSGTASFVITVGFLSRLGLGPGWAVTWLFRRVFCIRGGSLGANSLAGVASVL